MKRLFSAWILVLALLLTLSACGAPAAQPAPEKEAAPAAAASEAPQDVAGAEGSAQQETAAKDAAADKTETLDKIREMKGQSVDALIEWLGEPISREYSSSCLVEGGQDGQLLYDGFTVYTLVQPDGAETVYDCE